MACYVCFTPAGTSLEDVLRVAGTRWAIETCVAGAKGEVGLDQYEVRTWDGWYRPITLALIAHAMLAAIRARADKKGACRRRSYPRDVSEVRRLLARRAWHLALPVERTLLWCDWRDRHQMQARRNHYQRQSARANAEV